MGERRRPPAVTGCLTIWILDPAALYIAVLVLLLILTIFSLATVLYRMRRNRKGVEKRNDAYLTSQEDFLYDDLHNDEKYNSIKI